MELREELYEYGKKAKEASLKLTVASTKEKNLALRKIAENLRKNIKDIEKENEKDIVAGKERGLSKAMLDRLLLTSDRIESMASGVEKIATLTDPVGEILTGWTTEDGIKIRKVRVPIGVIAMIYESRPNVTADASALALKSGNAIILRGGKEAINSNKIIAKIIKESLDEVGLPSDSINLVQTIDREAVKILTQMVDYIDVIIPRGGSGLIKAVTENAKVPVIYHDKGLCHTYVDEMADIEMAKKICFNAKVQRPGVCNAMETMLVNKNIAEEFLPQMAEEFKKAGVELRGCKQTKQILKDIKLAEEKDWDTEYLDLILSIKMVDSVDEAITHINKHGSKHSEAIVTKDYESANKFLNGIDASTVYVNASTRFTDGAMFGFGAEIGISTNKLHARGPVALAELTTYKYIVEGNGQIR
ncbi:glutamate-5-semialdehyde dehydrogenase [Haliovirga abyssi]|uniref:Gamma-glutamyl phosphate reductase n=1 Tax=Haliovirga abyssi TaxID=2996794 RepID=A0AAU9D9P0_9FUSO|nr:glutamate-5-semialdehyde dehydrogenase [Haliovirga abyssi]BDU51348.1 gamma-glutamyl phosphate reductase [Haliovirga abyssi]